MKNNFVAKSSIEINTTVDKVWDAITNPEIIKQYFFGVDVVTDWKEGSSIIYKGMWEGKPFEDKGEILKIEPKKLLITSYWTSFSGLEDIPENYQNVTYKLENKDKTTVLTIEQNNIDTKDTAKHSEDNWNYILSGLKKLLEQ